jgi:hypothetical protein
VLDLEQFGRWGIAEPILLLLSQSILFGANFAIFEVARATSLDVFGVGRQWLGKLLPVFLCLLPVAWLVAAVSGIDFLLCLLAWAVIGVEACLLLMQAATRAVGQSSLFLMASILKAVPWLGGLFVFAMAGAGDLRTIFVIRFVAALVPATYLFMRRKTRFDVEYSLGAAVRYGLPITLAAALLPLGEALERMMLAAFFSLEATGTYVIAAKYAGILALGVFTPVGLWCRVSAYACESCRTAAHTQLRSSSARFPSRGRLHALAASLLPRLYCHCWRRARRCRPC